MFLRQTEHWVSAFQPAKSLAQAHKLGLLERMVMHEDHAKFMRRTLDLGIDRIVSNVV